MKYGGTIMKKFIIGLVLVFALMGGTSALASVDSPVATPNQDEPAVVPVSPKTSDVNVLAIAGVGVVCAAAAVACGVKSKNNA